MRNIDPQYYEKYFRIAGVDEAGRGPLAGPVTAAAVILPHGFIPEGLDDSKKLNASKREKLYEIIVQNALDWKVVSIDHRTIDAMNILRATFLAMEKAVRGLTLLPEYVLIDGRDFPLSGIPGEAVIGGDGKSVSIAAASILAKVTRDRLMIAYDAQFPGYGFAAHKGYGTRAHREAIRSLGPCEIHRRSFLKKILESNRP